MASVELAGKPIVITGASSGIGDALARAAARAGMPVALGARRLDRLEAIAESIRAAGGRAIAVRCDVTRPESCAELVGRSREAFGPAYALFAGAGFGEKHDLLRVPEGVLREMFEVNYFGTLNAIRAAAPEMVERGRGHVVICSSCLSALPTPGYSVYSATKAAQHHAGRALGVELLASGVWVTTVHPVRTETEFFDTMRARRGGVDVPRGTSRPGQTAEFVADRVLGVLERPRPELWLTKRAELGFKLAAVFPKLVDRFVWKPRHRSAFGPRATEPASGSVPPTH